MAVIALGLIGTRLSTLYRHDEFIGDKTERIGTSEVSYGFPFGWHGYSRIEFGLRVRSPPIYWFLLASLLLDVVFWFATSSVGCIAVIKSMNVLRKTRTSKNMSVINI